ncbi:hypothetical protein MMC26_004455 [Xylographa opegraphella]|nr:hypothetical protein [Xylographa opegraphella]
MADHAGTKMHDLEAAADDHATAIDRTKKAKKGVDAGRKGHKAYDRATKIKALIAALVALVVIALALGLGLGLGLKKNSGGSSSDSDNDNRSD